MEAFVGTAPVNPGWCPTRSCGNITAGIKTSPIHSIYMAYGAYGKGAQNVLDFLWVLLL